ncbi:MAG: hypothetical protein C0608_05620 [Deltaproteobacteria bacterium]|nr:MAG: hypothetical protein C0608_05620 [Deltaproteobacteria bacterium]
MDGAELRFYRDYAPSAGGGKAFRAAIETTDLFIRAERSLKKEALLAIREAREIVEEEIALSPEFLTSLTPLGEREEAPPLVRSMYRAGVLAGTGPMAAVAGAVAGYVGKKMREHSPWVLVENGGDLYLDTGRVTTVGLWAGTSPFSGKLAFKVDATKRPIGVCTSSGTVGPSLSYGRADAATVLSHDVALADAVATELGNRIKRPAQLEDGVDWALSVEGVFGAIAIMGGRLALRGDLELEKL